MNTASLVIENLRAINKKNYPFYEKIIEHVFSTHNPIFSKDWFSNRYYELSRDDEWFANSLVSNSCLEGYGSSQIWKFSNKLTNTDFIKRVRQHALDESRHSTMFIKMLHLTYPGIQIDDETQKEIDAMQPRYTQQNHPEITTPEPSEAIEGHDAINELIQVHITEIRALVLQVLLRKPLLTHAPEESHERLLMFSNSLIHDEARHIDYTAEIFENLCKNSNAECDFIFETFTSRTKDFNELTLEEIEREEMGI